VVLGLTHRCGYRITCQRGVHVPPRRRRTTCRILSPSHDPTESRIVVRRRPFAGDASVWNPVRQLLRASGQHRGAAAYRAGLTVREEQEPFGGWTPDRGYVELRARAVITARSMVAFWVVGLEDRPERSAEICVAGISATLWSLEIGRGRHGTTPVPGPGSTGRLSCRSAAHRCGTVPQLRSRLDARYGHLLRGRNSGTQLCSAAVVSDANDACRVRLSGTIHCRRRERRPGSDR
jgi:hypothetical protein